MRTMCMCWIQVLFSFMVGMTNLYHSHRASEAADQRMSHTNTPASESFRGFRFIPLLSLLALFIEIFATFIYTVTRVQVSVKFVTFDDYYHYSNELCLQIVADNVHAVLFDLRSHNAGQSACWQSRSKQLTFVFVRYVIRSSRAMRWFQVYLQFDFIPQTFDNLSKVIKVTVT